MVHFYFHSCGYRPVADRFVFLCFPVSPSLSPISHLMYTNALHATPFALKTKIQVAITDDKRAFARWSYFLVILDAVLIASNDEL